MLSFYAAAPEEPRDDLLAAYREVIEKRNGCLTEKHFPNREAWLEQSAQWPVRHCGHLDEQTFFRNYQRFDASTHPSLAMLVLLAFVKLNAGEEYGVKMVSAIRHARSPTSDLFETMERLLAHEETYHTRILSGATRQFSLPEPSQGWKPTITHKILFSVLARAPKSIFHPVLLGAEIAGAFILNWMLVEVEKIFRDEPALRDTLEQRLIEILIDEVGHIAFNRLAVGIRGQKIAKQLAIWVAQGTTGGTPEFKALGWNNTTLDQFGTFDFSSLPETVRTQSFFI
jgi:hypothetical protein